jgi:hypothetical protein
MKLCFITLGGLVVIALVAAGCGGGGDAGGGERQTNSKTLTKAEFVRRADKICEQVDETQKAAFRNYFAKHPEAVESESLNRELVSVIGLPPLRTEVSQLDALPAPSGDEKEVQAIIFGLEEAVNKSEEEPDLLVNLKNGAGPFTAVGKLAREYGFKACALPL